MDHLYNMVLQWRHKLPCSEVRLHTGWTQKMSFLFEKRVSVPKDEGPQNWQPKNPLIESSLLIWYGIEIDVILLEKVRVLQLKMFSY